MSSTRPVSTPWLTREEAAKYLRVSKEKLSVLVASGEIPGHPGIGYDPEDPMCKVLIHTDDLDAYMRSRSMGVKAGAVAYLRYQGMKGVA